jgi:hypothetical protein
MAEFIPLDLKEFELPPPRKVLPILEIDNLKAEVAALKAEVAELRKLAHSHAPHPGDFGLEQVG